MYSVEDGKDGFSITLVLLDLKTSTASANIVDTKSLVVEFPLFNVFSQGSCGHEMRMGLSWGCSGADIGDINDSGSQRSGGNRFSRDQGEHCVCLR